MMDDCQACLGPPFRASDFGSRRIGIDQGGGRFGEVRVDLCRTCGRLWLVYAMEIEGFSESGRWFRGEIDSREADAMTPEKALPYLGGLDWYFAGGSYFRSLGTRTAGEILAF